MCGYVVECALKACICKNTNQFDFYPRRAEYDKAWSHNIKNLMAVSGVKSAFDAARNADMILDVNWKEAEDWSEESRYDPKGRKDAEGLFTAVSDPDHGVFACIKRNW